MPGACALLAARVSCPRRSCPIAQGLLAPAQSAKLIQEGSLKLLLWEGYWGCEGWPRCTAQEQYAYERAVAYQPLQFSVTGAHRLPGRTPCQCAVSCHALAGCSWPGARAAISGSLSGLLRWAPGSLLPPWLRLTGALRPG